MCGIAAFNGKSKPNLAKMKLLGIDNIIRGRDSCGIFYDGIINKGVLANKEFDDFLQKNLLIENHKLKNHTCIIHTRSSTFGENTYENAHPFLVKRPNDSSQIVLAHNGTLENHDDLLLKYGLPIDFKVDSKALAALIAHRGWHILNEYIGYAALTVFDTQYPDSLFVYHGASKEYSYESCQLTEERPLFYAKHKEGIYLSSREEGLLMIRDGQNQEPQRLPVNEVFKITNGEFVFGESIHIDRTFNNVGILAKKNAKKTNYYPTVQNYHSRNTSVLDTTVRDICKMVSNIPKQTRALQNTTSHLIDMINTKKLNIYEETLPPKCFTIKSDDRDFVFYFQGRYQSSSSNQLLNGIYLLDKKGFIYSDDEKEQYNSKGIIKHYFYRGIKIINSTSYNELIKTINNDLIGEIKGVIDDITRTNVAFILSQFSTYPICNIGDEYSASLNRARSMFWFNKSVSNKSYTPVFSERSYVYQNGELVKTSSIVKEDVMFIEGNLNKYANAELIITDNDNDVDVEAEDEGIPSDTNLVSNLLPFFKRTWESMDDIIDNCPSTVLRALELYCTNMLDSIPFTADDNSIEDASEYANVFLTTCLNDKISFEENMMEGYKEPIEYLNTAYNEEVNNQTSNIVVDAETDLKESQFTVTYDENTGKSELLLFDEIADDPSDNYDIIHTRKSPGRTTISVKKKSL